MNKERLLLVAQALRESKDPDKFDMGQYVNECGTPACAIGHFAFRTDLQDICRIRRSDDDPGEESFDVVYARSLGDAREGNLMDYDDDEILVYFGIDYDDAWKLFGGSGCGDAGTANQAAEFIERFVAEHS